MQSCYTTTAKKLSSGFIEFTTSRPLDCGVNDSYLVETDTLLPLIAAWSTDGPEMSYHFGNILQF